MTIKKKPWTGGWAVGSENIRVGRAGEASAERFLRKRGYKIVEKNFRTRFGELDIIARDGATLVFVEVKARRGSGFGAPIEAVGYRKQSNLTMAAGLYMEERRLHDMPVRFDVVGILGEGPGAKIELVQNAFDAVE